jgi:hypothetical protein
MGGIDRLISTTLSAKIKKELDVEILKKVERELFLEYGISIKLSIEHFEKFTSVLKNYSNYNINEINKKCINEIFKIKKNNNNYVLTIIDLTLTNFFLELFGDTEIRKLIQSVLKEKHTIPQILKETKVAKTSGYRKIENLILKNICRIRNSAK